MKQQREIRFSRNNDNYIDYDDDEPDDIDYRMDQEGNIHGFIREITCTPDGGSTDSNFDWDRHFHGMESLGGQSGDIGNDYVVGPPATKPAQQTEKKPQTQQTAQDAAAIARAERVLAGVQTGDTTAVMSEKLRKAAEATSLGFSFHNLTTVDLVKALRSDPGVMAKIGAGLNGFNLVTGGVLLYFDLSDGEKSQRDWANLIAYSLGATGTIASLVFAAPAVAMTLGIMSIAVTVVAYTLPGDGETKSSTQYSYYR